MCAAPLSRSPLIVFFRSGLQSDHRPCIVATATGWEQRAATRRVQIFTSSAHPAGDRRRGAGDHLPRFHHYPLRRARIQPPPGPGHAPSRHRPAKSRPPTADGGARLSQIGRVHRRRCSAGTGAGAPRRDAGRRIQQCRANGRLAGGARCGAHAGRRVVEGAIRPAGAAADTGIRRAAVGGGRFDTMRT